MLDIFDDRWYPYDNPKDDWISNEVWWEDQVLYWVVDTYPLINYTWNS